MAQAITDKMGRCKRSKFQAPVIRQGQPETQTLNNVPNDVILLSQTDAPLLPRMRLFPCARLEVGIVYNGRTRHTVAHSSNHSCSFDVFWTVHHIIELRHLPTLMHNSFIH